MIKKITMASVATLALLVMPAQADCNHCKDGMTQQKSNKMGKKGGQCHKKMGQRGQGSALLVHLPSPMRMLMKLDKDPKLALTAEQKTKFEAQRKEMMPKMMKLKQEIKALSKEIKEACKKSETVAQQKVRVEKLATLKTEATILKLTCIAKVKETLTKDQQTYMKSLRDARMKKMKEMRMKMKEMREQMQAMRTEMQQ